MTINGFGNSYFNYASYQTTGTYGNTDQSSSYQQVQNENGGPGGPVAPPPPRGGGRGGQVKGPDLDTDSDGLWSTEEIDTFASDTGISIDTDEIISTYDTDGDGAINEDERVALGRDNAFNLPSPKDMMNQMKGFSPPPNIQQSNESSTSLFTETEESTTSQLIQQLMEAYEQQNIDYYTDTDASTVTFTL